jgi:aryl-alcohol dehydrogenase-like predicted oxidoreductase
VTRKGRSGGGDGSREGLRTLFESSRLILGLGRLHHLGSPRAREDLVATGIANGVRSFDVAPAYGNGLSERVLGRVAARMGVDVQVHTKYGIPVPAYAEWSELVFRLRRAVDIVVGSSRVGYRSRCFSPRELQSSLGDSLERLRRKKVEIMFLHEPLEPLNEVLWLSVRQAMEALVAEGRVGGWGVAGPVSRWRNAAGMGMEEVIQMPLTEYHETQPVRAKRVILFGVHAAYRRLRESRSFESYVRDVTERSPGADLVLETTRIDRLRAWLEAQ